MRRRQFILLFCGAPITWPRVARAQKPHRVRRIGVLMGLSESNPEFRGFFATFVEELTRLGWIDGRNARIEQMDECGYQAHKCSRKGTARHLARGHDGP